MKSHRAGLLKSVAIAIGIVSVVICGHSKARADEVTISGFTTGTVTGIPQLTFTGNPNFTNTTSPGSVVGAGALSGANNLGTFFLNTSAGQLVSGFFTLNVTFTSPTGIFVGQGWSFSATIQGSVSPNVDQGGVNINLDNTPVVFGFNNGDTSGFFSLELADMFVESGQSAALTAGTVGNQIAVPEPTTLLLLGTGVAGIAAKLRTRRTARKARDH